MELLNVSREVLDAAENSPEHVKELFLLFDDISVNAVNILYHAQPVKDRLVHVVVQGCLVIDVKILVLAFRRRVVVVVQ